MKLVQTSDKIHKPLADVLFEGSIDPPLNTTPHKTYAYGHKIHTIPTCLVRTPFNKFDTETFHSFGKKHCMKYTTKKKNIMC